MNIDDEFIEFFEKDIKIALDEVSKGRLYHLSKDYDPDYKDMKMFDYFLPAEKLHRVEMKI